MGNMGERALTGNGESRREMMPSWQKEQAEVERVLSGLSRRAAWSGGPPIANVLMARVLAQPDLISLAAGFVEHLSLPVELVERAIEKLFSSRTVALESLQYGTTLGHPRLRRAIWERLCQEDAAVGLRHAGPEQIVITAGSNQLLYLVAEALLDPGDIILCAAPSYFVFLGMIKSFGARSVGVACDHHGMIPDALEDRLAWLERRGELDRVKAIYVASYFDNPTGLSLASERRPALVEVAQRWSRKHRLYIIEDCAYRDLSYYEEEWSSLRSYDATGQYVVMLGSFSKSFSPGLRVGWGLLPPALLDPVLSLKGHHDFGSPNFNQMVMATILEEGWLEEHVARLRSIYRRKLEATLKAVEGMLRPVVAVEYVPPRGGLYVWLQLPEEWDTGVEGPLFQSAVEEGVVYVPGEYCFPEEGEPPRRCCLRVSFAMPDDVSLEKGMARLARAITRCGNTAPR